MGNGGKIGGETGGGVTGGDGDGSGGNGGGETGGGETGELGGDIIGPIVFNTSSIFASNVAIFEFAVALASLRVVISASFAAS